MMISISFWNMSTSRQQQFRGISQGKKNCRLKTWNQRHAYYSCPVSCLASTQTENLITTKGWSPTGSKLNLENVHQRGDLTVKRKISTKPKNDLSSSLRWDFPDFVWGNKCPSDRQRDRCPFDIGRPRRNSPRASQSCVLRYHPRKLLN